MCVWFDLPACVAAMHRVLSETVGSPKLIFVGMHLLWTAMLEPPVDQCEDPELTLGQSERMRIAIYDLFFPPKMSYNTTPAQCDTFAECYEVAAVVDPYVRAAQWVVAAPLPPAGSTGVYTSVPPLVVAVQDEATLGMESRAVSVSVFAFDGAGCAAVDANGAPSTMPTLVSDASNVTNAAGVAYLQLLLDASGCSEGGVILRLSTPSPRALNGARLSSFARVQLYRANRSAEFLSEATSVSTSSIDNYTDVTAESTVYINATVSLTLTLTLTQTLTLTLTLALTLTLTLTLTAKSKVYINATVALTLTLTLTLTLAAERTIYTNASHALGHPWGMAMRAHVQHTRTHVNPFLRAAHTHTRQPFSRAWAVRAGGEQDAADGHQPDALPVHRHQQDCARLREQHLLRHTGGPPRGQANGADPRHSHARRRPLSAKCACV